MKLFKTSKIQKFEDPARKCKRPGRGRASVRATSFALKAYKNQLVNAFDHQKSVFVENSKVFKKHKILGEISWQNILHYQPFF